MLFSLAILTLLFSAASTRTLASLQFSAAEIVASDREGTRVEVLDALIALGRPDSNQFDWGGRSLRLQSVGGLVDLNTAVPELLERLLVGYGLSATARADALQSYRAWRRTGYRLQRVSDFVRVTGLRTEDLPDLEYFATVHSGRARLSTEQAPRQLLQHLTGARGDTLVLSDLLPPDLVGPGSDTTFSVFDGEMRIGVVNFGPFLDLNSILVVN